MRDKLRPKAFFLGVILGILICSVAGFVVSQKARFQHFSRFFSNISPTLGYYPTAGELLGTARHNVSHDKILVLIGGSSIFRGEGQNPGEVWTDKLQSLLGDQYKVLNYAFNGADFPAFGGVAYRILKEEYPKIIFVSTCSWREESRIDGGNTYSYLFWDAYYKKLFHADAKEKAIIHELMKTQLKTAEGKEQHLLSYLDSILYFRNLWNWVGYRYVFTVWNKNVIASPFKPKHAYDDDVYDIKNAILNVKNDSKDFQDIIRKLSGGDFVKGVDFSRNSLNEEASNRLKNIYDTLYRPAYRDSTLCVISTYNPKYIAALPGADQKGHNITLHDTQSVLQSLGYHAMLIKDLTPDNYYDLQHYVSSGGNKIAAQVAAEVKGIAEARHYL